MLSKQHINALIVAISLGIMPGYSFGDISVIKEVVITPKGVNAAANIGTVNSSANVEMYLAKVDIHIGQPGVGALAPLPLNVQAVFELISASSDNLKLTVGFPVSNSQYSSFALSHFRVTTDGAAREVFRRKGAYPRQISHEYISGEKDPEKISLPAIAEEKSMNLSGESLIGEEKFQNLMIWEETFSPQQKKTIEINYEIEIPLQENKILHEKAKGNHKGVWPEEANNISVEFLEKLAPGAYYFFDYYLTSGASWAGPVAFEDVTLHFDSWWQDLDFHSTIKQGRLSWSNTTLYPGIPITAYYSLRDVEPTENVYFAIRPGKNNSLRAIPSDNEVGEPVVPEW